jgi:hypothetical protein
MNQPDVPNGNGEDPKVKVRINRCNQCHKEIEMGATTCHRCGSSQNKIWQIVKIVPVVMVALTIVQLALVSLEKIETSKILNEVENIKKQADDMLIVVKQTKNQAEDMLSKVEEKEKRVSQRLTDIHQQTNAIKNRIESAEQEFTAKQKALSQRITIIGDNAEKQIEASIKKVDAQVRKSNDRLLKAEQDFNKKNEMLTAELHTLKDEVSKDLEKLKWRSQLMLFTDEAISNGKRSSYEEIVKMNKNLRKTEKGPIVGSYLAQIKKFYINLNRFKSSKILKNGVEIDPNSISTSEAIKELAKNDNEIVRYQIAKMLGKRKELGVPEALLWSVKNDECLDVVARSVTSFEAITGFDSPDVLDSEVLVKYWEEKKDDIQKNLKEPETK